MGSMLDPTWFRMDGIKTVTRPSKEIYDRKIKKDSPHEVTGGDRLLQ